MDVEYTGRQTTVTDDLRALAGPVLDRMEKMLGYSTSAHVVITSEKHRQIAEVTVKTHTHDLVGLSESTISPEAALRLALDKAEVQAVRFKEKRATQHRQPKDEKMLVEPALERGGKGKRTGLMPTLDSPMDEALGIAPDRVPDRVLEEVGVEPTASGNLGADTLAMDSFAVEPHVRRTIDAVALGSMSLEEAVKELETRDREIFVFRDKAGLIQILHCKRDGTLEVIELP